MNARGERHGRAKLSMWDVIAIRCLLSIRIDPPSVSAIARAFEISRRTVTGIRSGKNWGWL